MPQRVESRVLGSGVGRHRARGYGNDLRRESVAASRPPDRAATPHAWHPGAECAGMSLERSFHFFRSLELVLREALRENFDVGAPLAAHAVHSMKNATPFAAGRPLDVICLGRFAVDFYAQQIGARLEDVTSFAKYLGGSSANTAFGCARLGLKAGLVSRIGDDANGHFLVETIAREGCDVSHVSVDPARLTGAVVLGIKDKDTFPLIFMRENCADMAIADEDVEESYIASARALLITGTHFSTEYINRISNQALDRADLADLSQHFSRNLAYVFVAVFKCGNKL